MCGGTGPNFILIGTDRTTGDARIKPEKSKINKKVKKSRPIYALCVGGKNSFLEKLQYCMNILCVHILMVMNYCIPQKSALQTYPSKTSSTREKI